MLTELIPQFPDESGDAREDLRALKVYLADWFRRLNEPDALAIAAWQQWTPTDASGAGLVITKTTALCMKVGQFVFAHADVSFPVTASGAIAVIGGLPYAPNAIYAGSVATNGGGNPAVCQADSSGVNFVSAAAVAVTNANFSNSIVRFGVGYFV